MMKVYIDLVIVINFIFDLIILSSINYILRRNSSMIRLVLGSVIGEFTLFSLFIPIDNVFFLFLKFLYLFLWLLFLLDIKTLNI